MLVTSREQLNSALQGLRRSALLSLHHETSMPVTGNTIALDVEWTAGIKRNDGSVGRVGVL